MIFFRGHFIAIFRVGVFWFQKHIYVLIFKKKCINSIVPVAEGGGEGGYQSLKNIPEETTGRSRKALFILTISLRSMKSRFVFVKEDVKKNIAR